ncbi:type II toxin-antitoxin system HicB family antitoxin [Ligilactobacillus salivarius]|uniref:HicB family protein n=1 Tax=Ligilactobacillus salivarius TaxID=1624 RepID=A0A6A8LSW5_9LACO|nr:type II toxin-antitoxin system HicB family antitoxin [Ligilactobacillus salivarius]MCF2622962.1 type II toxin-antitoxin system HicB family antitoxin [Ligilactobacillus salivarius]MSE05320.1 HicB family protein [Ligilactobacillus salivarius]MSE07663.1 HicB family protein [Ligilactobacillus salivarius]WII29453.1 type II toxin-antitoxin system HicB family antitoxin [Ligilactobacillus salivarius]
MSDKRVIYPVIVGEYHDDGDYFVATSPNIPGMVTQGDSLADVAYWAEDAIATMIAGEEYPEPQDPKDWKLKDNERVIYVSVNMAEWIKQHPTIVRRNISLPDYLNNWAKENNINVSKVTTEALKQLAGI